ncbi:MAG: 1-(5-phosphoribosyl)-5-amino-4-imidazole-carboxylate carboxylase [Nitrospirae bacterium CG_4_10_14_0_8_um_filter_41_23]|nr:nickel pincer cofactor biosynthesis protein LarB [Nitrospirota bacterium]PIQ95198.1 MAG: 1-(5-phosphoribosyl)-5-amino-4-imidazole-carboxylate carboxylase [Nitrospirae bacterium CG11_big_fil_rev_8_21_14_0_20_41_14]PIV41023.1 MAG: 1-(5-phosphoribosyl)-5-amino-4-imidazole-carboxylate carboxylase [Nitrospirae bacterium CG02_land_8_20_14_3_00_41_53]PIW87554.1 MAG: 1-(5-phosphoribosyl)-5-amino-4-imidazole-carboxylate carboxylase [Nitrospirae bacterium CG_4_8_14_3_um_filter_41_47]PIY86356.1 MAG: 1-
MDSSRIKNILKSVQSSKISIERALDTLKHLPYEDLSFAKIDHHRHIRQGIPEVIFAEGKRIEDVIVIARSIFKKSKKLLITKASKEIYDGLKIRNAVFHPLSGAISANGEKKKKGCILILSAGTSDIPVAEEAAVTASFLGSRVETIYDVGIAGIHRLMDTKKSLDSARVIIVVAGMEGALPSVVGGLIDKPIIAVPTSIGYGTSLNGLTALFAMLNSCVPGIAVMNIDNGFGAGCLAHKINTL